MVPYPKHLQSSCSQGIRDLLARKLLEPAFCSSPGLSLVVEVVEGQTFLMLVIRKFASDDRLRWNVGKIN